MVIESCMRFILLVSSVWTVLGKENKMESQISMFRVVLDLKKKMITIHLSGGLLIFVSLGLN